MKPRTDDRLEGGKLAHILVCTNHRDSDYPCCSDADGAKVTDTVKDWLRDRDAYWTPISVSTTSCLGLCSEGGAAITVQPHDEWYSDVRPEDVPELLSSLFGPEAEEIRSDKH